MLEDNKAIARRSWEEVANQKNLDLIEELFAPDLVWHEPDREIQGYEQAKQYMSKFFGAFPDINVTVDDVIAEGDKVVTRYTGRGTHQGEAEDFGPPTGRQIEFQGISIYRFEGGKIVEEWALFDNLRILQQLGLLPGQ
jgi:steroid delta-isomerase-like uncharacterized protein